MIMLGAPLCSGLARRPLKAVARVRIPSGLPDRNDLRLGATSAKVGCPNRHSHPKRAHRGHQLPPSGASGRSTASAEPSSKRPPYRVGMKATLLCPAHSDTSRTLHPAATRTATKLCRRPWKVTPSRPARVMAGRQTPRANMDRNNGPPRPAPLSRRRTDLRRARLALRLAPHRRPLRVALGGDPERPQALRLI
jgi:hypothetical protein